MGAVVESEAPDWVAVAGDEMRDEQWSPWVQTLEHDGAGFAVVGPVCFSPDGTWLAAALQSDCCGETKRKVQVWDVVTGNRVWTLRDAGGWMAFPPNSSLLGTTAAGAGGVRFWDLAKGAWHHRVIDLLDISAAAFSPDGVWLAAADGDYLGIWDWERGDRALRFCHGAASSAGSVAYSADSTRLASAHRGEVRIWNAGSGSQLRCISNVEATLVAFSPESSAGGKLISVSNESLVTWSTETGERLGMLDVLSEHDVYSAAALSIDGRYFAAAPEGTITTWDTATRRRLQTLQGYDKRVRSLVFSPDGRQLATMGAWGLRLYRAAAATDGGVLRATRDHPDKISILRLAPGGGGTIMLSASASTIKIWDLAVQGHRPREIKTAKGGILDVALSHDGGRLVTLSSREDAEVWDTETGRRLQTIPDYCVAASFSSEGARIAILTASGTLKIWVPAEQRYVRVFQQPALRETRGGEFGAGSVVFAPDGRIATSLDRVIRLWRLGSRSCTQTLADDATAKVLLFSSDGRRLAASYHDRIKIWDLAGGCCLQTLDARGSRRVNVVAFDAGRSQLLTDVGLFLLDDKDISRTGTGTENAGREIRRQGYGVDADSGWVMWNSDKMLWLPPAYRPDSTAVLLPEPGASTPSTIALGCRSGRVVVLRFPTKRPPAEAPR
jgi:WD40 repeat protein